MIVLRPTTEDEMVLAFVKGEADSPRFGFRARLGAIDPALPAQVIDNPDPRDARANAIRRSILRKTRGYGVNRGLFRGFPPDVTWQRIRLDPPDLPRLRYANLTPWVTLSGGTRLLRDGAANVGKVATEEDVGRHIQAVVEELGRGCRYPELIAVEGDGASIVLMEGHTRATAYVVAGYGEPVEVIVGRSRGMRQWAFY